MPSHSAPVPGSPPQDASWNSMESGDPTVSQAVPRLAFSAAAQPRWLPRHLHDRYDIRETRYTNL
eukprot:1458662-Heterocapsa_arctica.AAC.1